MYESHSDSTSTYVTLLGRAKEIAATIKGMRGPGEFGSQEMFDLQNELSEILARLAAEVARENKKQFPRESIQGTKGFRASA